MVDTAGVPDVPVRGYGTPTRSNAFGKAVISDITVAELLRGPEKVQSLLERPELRDRETVRLDEEAVLLAETYIREGVVVKDNRVDARHIAVATVQRVDMLVSWNFRHIVKWSRIRGYNAVNLKLGYPQLEIRSPWEAYYEEG